MSGQRSADQTFLIGETLYLRPLDPSDADTAPQWTASPWPAPPDVVKERIEHQLGNDLGAQFRYQRMLLCRRSDDQPVGAVDFAYRSELRCRLFFSFGANRSRDHRAWAIGETLRMALPWLIGERGMMTVHFNFPGEHPLLEATALELGMLRNCRFREQLPMAGVRYDSVGYEAVHPDWLTRFGMPSRPAEGAVERETLAPAPLAWNPRFAPPPAAIVAGDRLYLRALTGEDSERAARATLVETERSYAEGRIAFNPYVTGQFTRESARQQPPGWIRFAIVLGETGEPIGSNGLMDIDLLEGSAETETELWSAHNRGQGYGTEAKHLLLEYAFDHLGLHMIYSWISGFNTRSIAAIRKQGYRDAGYLSWAEFHGAEPSSALGFDLLAAEWRAARR